ncbi:MAG: helix-turn-helix transcriptional regulator [Pseudomonadota bacterium]
MDEFPARLLLALKVLSISRGRLASELAVDKSVVSRWLSGRQAPSGENLANLTRLVAQHRPGFTLLDWEQDLDSLAARLGVAPEPASGRFGPLAGWLPEAVLQEAQALTALRGADYEGFWRTTRPAIGLPGRFMHDRVMIRRADNGFLNFRLRVEDMQFDGWTFPTQTQLFSLAADARSGLFVFTIYNAVLRHKAEVLDGISLTIQRVGGGSPVAGASIMERIGDLSGDMAADDATYAELTAADPLAPEGSISPRIQAHILPDVGPLAMAAGGAALLTMPFAGSWSRGPDLEPRPLPRSDDA